VVLAGVGRHPKEREVMMGKRILVVDDNTFIRSATRNVLEGHPQMAECHEAIDGVDALEKAQALKPDLIILDLSMPRMNGLAAACELKKMRAAVKIILFTVYANAVPLQVAKAAGISAVVSKADLPSLNYHVEKVLQGVNAGV